jgi:hypothetical protein
VSKRYKNIIENNYMIIINNNTGRLGNLIFRLFANIVFCILYDINAQIISQPIDQVNFKWDFVVTDEYFLNVMNSFLNGNSIPKIHANSVILFEGYFQHDKIYTIFKSYIIDFILERKDIVLRSDNPFSNGKPDGWIQETYNAIDLIQFNLNKEKQHKIVIHLRLEDFISLSWVMNPKSIKQKIDEILQGNKETPFCIVLNKPKTELECNYLSYLTKEYKNVTIESNDPITDFNIMKNAKTLVCSCSTLSWNASLLSDTVETVYMPNREGHRPNWWIWETFKKPIENTITYNFDTCSIQKLNEILDER